MGETHPHQIPKHQISVIVQCCRPAVTMIVKQMADDKLLRSGLDRIVAGRSGVNDLDFADDIALLESPIPRAQAQL